MGDLYGEETLHKDLLISQYGDKTHNYAIIVTAVKTTNLSSYCMSFMSQFMPQHFNTQFLKSKQNKFIQVWSRTQHGMIFLISDSKMCINRQVTARFIFFQLCPLRVICDITVKDSKQKFSKCKSNAKPGYTHIRK